jgi:hypothetical protein
VFQTYGNAQTQRQLAPYNRRILGHCFDTATCVEHRASCLAWAFDRRVTVITPAIVHTSTTTGRAAVNQRTTPLTQQRAYRDSFQLRTPRFESQLATTLLNVMHQVQSDPFVQQQESVRTRVRRLMPMTVRGIHSADTRVLGFADARRKWQQFNKCASGSTVAVAATISQRPRTHVRAVATFPVAE